MASNQGLKDPWTLSDGFYPASTFHEIRMSFTFFFFWLQLSFIWQTKENTSSRHEGRPSQKKYGSILAPHFLCFSPSPEPAVCKLG